MQFNVSNQSMKTLKVCETSLLWILAMRARRVHHNYNPQLFTMQKHPEVLGLSEMHSFGHSSGSLVWTVREAKRMDALGLEQWLQTENARGYSAYISSSLSLM